MFAVARCAVLIAVFALLLPNCSGSPRQPSTALVAPIPADCPAPGDDYFFPRGILDKSRPDSDLFSRHWYSEPLMRMGEPSLSCGREGDAETYRFLWLRTFHHPISVRISRSLEKVEIEAFELSGAGGYDPGIISKHISKTASVSEWQRLETALDSADFWNLPTNLSPETLGVDGAQWIVEGRRNGSYHVVDRWTPGASSYKALGLLFLQLAGFSVTGTEVY